MCVVCEISITNFVIILGDVDFYPNGVNPLPPGCYSMSCAHQRAPEYYAESVYPGQENHFMAVKCDSLSSLNSNFCNSQAYPMGYATPHNLKGNFFLKTNENRPYGLNANKNATVKCSGRRPLMNKSDVVLFEDDIVES